MLSEVSPAGFPDYLWGRDAQHVFEALPRGFSLATALHAGTLDEAFEVLTAWNGIPDALASRIDLVTYIVSVGPWPRPTRRAVAAMYEVDAVVDGQPQARLLHRWDASLDRFESVEAPRTIGTDADLGAALRHFGAV